MSEAELAEFLAAGHTVICATNGPRGLPHLMPLWYVMRPQGGGGAPATAAEAAGHRAAIGPADPWAWTYAKSQKTKNLAADPRATLQVEAGETYDQLRGVMLECDVEVSDDLDTVRAIGLEIFGKYTPGDELPAEVVAAVEAQARKRVAMHFIPRRVVSWDHRKLGGVY